MDMEWYKVATIVISNLGMFLWAVRQSRSDYLNCQRSTDTFKDAMAKETKDFHARLALQDQEFKIRLCNIEEKNKKQ